MSGQYVRLKKNQNSVLVYHQKVRLSSDRTMSSRLGVQGCAAAGLAVLVLRAQDTVHGGITD